MSHNSQCNPPQRFDVVLKIEYEWGPFDDRHDFYGVLYAEVDFGGRCVEGEPRLYFEWHKQRSSLNVEW